MSADVIAGLVLAACLIILLFVPPVAWWLDARQVRREQAQERVELIAEGMRYGLDYVPGEDLNTFRSLVIRARDKVVEKEGRRA